jgi:hypothetical protein
VVLAERSEAEEDEEVVLEKAEAMAPEKAAWRYKAREEGGECEDVVGGAGLVAGEVALERELRRASEAGGSIESLCDCPCLRW